MFKNKGFTLIEILAVVTILGIISVLAFPYVDNLLKKTKENEYNRFLDDIYLATEAYLIDHQEEYSLDGDTEYVSVKKLVENGYLKSTIINPDTNKKINLDTSIKITIADNSYNYEYINDINADIDGYVTDGLVLHYDGYKKPVLENGSLLWKDLSGNGNDGILYNFSSDINSFWDGNSISFDGINDYITLNNILYGKTNFTIEYVANQKQLKAWEYLFGINDNLFGVESGSSGYRALYYSQLKHLKITSIMGDNNSIVNNALIFEDNSIIACKDGVPLVNETLSSIELGAIDSGFAIGASNISGSYPMLIDYYSFRIYNRALTEEEINKNYEIDKERFGI